MDSMFTSCICEANDGGREDNVRPGQTVFLIPTPLARHSTGLGARGQMPGVRGQGFRGQGPGVRDQGLGVKGQGLGVRN